MAQKLKSAFGFLFAMWGGFWFMLVVAIFAIIYKVLFLFTKDKFVRLCIWINCHYLCNFLLFLCLVRKRVHGSDQIVPSKNYIYVCNHVTQFDTIVAASCLPHPVRFVAKGELVKIPFFGSMVKSLGIPVDRQDKNSRTRSLSTLIDYVQRGESAFLFPEGTRNKTDQPLIPFKNGAFSTAILTSTPIVVITLVGMKKINEAKGIQLYPGTVDVHFSKPISTSGMTLSNLELLKTRVADEMLKTLAPNPDPLVK